MSKCIRCSINETLSNSKICPTCLDKWSNMREKVFDHCIEQYGTLSPTNHKDFIKLTKKLEKLWKKNPEEFSNYFNNL